MYFFYGYYSFVEYLILSKTSIVLDGQISALAHYFNVLYVQKVLLFVQKTKTEKKRIKSKRLKVLIQTIMSKKVKDMC